MQDYVTFETAVKLKEAGFPQPEIRFSQMFYVAFIDIEEIGRYVYITCVWDSDSPCLATNPIFAPRATDIMLHLPNLFQLASMNDGGMWAVLPPAHMEDEVLDEYSTNAAEAAAQMWLKLNQK